MLILQGMVLRLRRERVLYAPMSGLHGLPYGSIVQVLGASRSDHETIIYVFTNSGTGYMNHINGIENMIYDVL